MEKQPHQLDESQFAQLDALIQNPIALLNALSTIFHHKADARADALSEFSIEEFGAGKPWRATAEVIDLARALWQEEEYSSDMWRRLLAGSLENIQRTVQSYLRP